MLLIADSGGTKTSWCLSDDAATEQLRFETHGINPVHQDEDAIRAVLHDEFFPNVREQLQTSGASVSVFFYGAGCAGEAGEMMKSLLGEVLGAFCCRRIEVESDLVGAARALCGRQPGIACILGTGANSCLYDGERVVENIPPLGYILGDEGSGAVLGKLFLNALFKKRLPDSMLNAYLQETGLTYPTIINKVYREPLANRFLASTSVFIRKHIDECEELRQIVTDNFRDFFRKNVARYGDASPVSFIGSLAQVYEKELREAAAAEGFEVGLVEKSPMDGMLRYHAEYRK